MFDIAPNILILVNIYYAYYPSKLELFPFPSEITDDTRIIFFWRMQATAALVLWLKFIISLRVFPSIGFLIHMFA